MVKKREKTYKEINAENNERKKEIKKEGDRDNVT